MRIMNMGICVVGTSKLTLYTVLRMKQIFQKKWLLAKPRSL